MPDVAPLLNDESDHPQETVVERNGRRVQTMDSMRYVDPRNGSDVVVAASYLGVLPSRLAAPHKPHTVIGHDGCVGKDAAGIAGLGYLEALGIPAATGAGMTAELGNGLDLYETGLISYVNVFAEELGVKVGMTVKEAAELLLDGDTSDTEPTAHVSVREVMEEHDGHQVVVTDSIVFALPEDAGKNVLVTAAATPGAAGPARQGRDALRVHLRRRR